MNSLKKVILGAVVMARVMGVNGQDLNPPANLSDVYVLRPVSGDIICRVDEISPSNQGNEVIGVFAYLGSTYFGVTTYERSSVPIEGIPICDQVPDQQWTTIGWYLLDPNNPNGTEGICLGVNTVYDGYAGTCDDNSTFPIISQKNEIDNVVEFVFDRASYPLGTHVLKLGYDQGWDWDDFILCDPSATTSGTRTRDMIVVSSLTYSGATVLCEGDGALDLSGYVNVPGGTFSGTGVIGTTFDPLAAGSGTHSISYSYDFANRHQLGGTTVVNFNITVQSNTVNAGTNQSVCSDDAVFVLTGVTPVGGTWSGPGITGSSFDPSAAAIGNNILTYTATVNGCDYEDTKIITVKANPVVEASANVNVCRPREGESVVNASVTSGSSPGGGTWTCSNCLGFTLETNGTFPNDAPVGTYDLTYTVITSGCEASDTKTLTVTEPPSVIMPEDPVVCTGDDVQLNPIVTGTGLSYSWSPTTGLNDPFKKNPTVNNVTTTRDYTLTVTSSNGCDEFGSITVIHDPGTAVNAGSNITNMCESDDPFNITGGSPSGGTWSGSGVSGGVFNPGNVTTGINHTITYTFINGNGCETSDTRIFKVNADPVVEAGPNDEICYATSGKTNIATGSSPNGGVWTCPTCPTGTITNSSTGDVKLNTAPGTYQFIYTYTSPSGCSDTDVKNITWNELPVAVAISDQEICEIGNSVELDVNVSGGSGGLSYSWSPSGTLDDPFSKSPLATPINNNTVYTVQVTDAAGCSTSDQVTISVIGNPVVEAGSDFSVCADQAVFNLTGGSPAGGTWSGPGVVSGKFFDPSSVPAGLTHELTYSFTNGFGCGAEDTRLITVNDVPTVTIGSSFEGCSNDDPITLGGGSPSGGTWTGSGVSLGKWYPSIAGVGTHTLTYTYTDGNGCSAFATTNGKVNQLPIVEAGSNQIVCINEGVISLNGFSPPGMVFSGTGIVGVSDFDPSVSGLGTFNVTGTYTDGNSCVASDTRQITVVNFVDVKFKEPSIALCKNDGVLNLNTNLDAATPTGGVWSGVGISGVNFNPASVSAGTYALTYTNTNGSGCEDSNSFDVVVSNNPTITFLQATFDVCSNGGTVDLALSSPSPSGGTWLSPYVAGGVFDPSLVPGAGTYLVTYQVGATCQSESVVSVKVSNPTSVDAGPNLKYCENDEPKLLTGASVSGGIWSGAGVSGNYFDPSNVGVGSYEITYSYTNNKGCVSSDTRTISVNGQPVVDAGSNLTLCSNGGTYSLIADVSISGGSFTSQNGGVVGLNFDPSVVSTGVYEVVYHYTNPITNCSATDSRFITVVNPANVNVGGAVNVCIDGAPLDLTLIPTSINGGAWSGLGVVGTDFNPALVGVGSHEIYYEVTDGNGCQSVATKTIVVEALPVVNAGTDEFVCEGAPLVALEGSGSPIGGTWSGAFVVGGNFDVGASGSGIFTVTYTYTNGTGCTNSDTKDIIVDAATVVSAGPDFSVCDDDPLVDLASLVTPGGGSFSGPGISGNNFDPSVGPGTYSITYSLTNAFGCNGEDDVLITVYPKPVVNAGTNESLCFNEAPLDLTLTASPSGGSFTGPGVMANTMFDPSIAGIGEHEVTYTYINGNGCVATDIRTISVTTLPEVSAGSNMFICISNGLIDLDLDADPEYGSWTGAGVSNGIFDPEVAGIGQHVVTYTITQGNGCTSTDTRVIQVFDDLNVDAGPDLQTCTNGQLINLNQGVNISNGEWSGPGVVGSNFDPSKTGPGIYELVYEVTNAIGCTGSDVVNVEVTAPAIVNVGSDIDICVTIPSFDLSGSVSPVGGTFSGSGISGSEFIPALAGLGKHIITYSIEDANGCTASKSREITVVPPPSIDAGANKVVCVDSDQVDLDLGASEGGGSWSGNGVSGGFFDPALAGIGSHIVTYALDDGSGCISTDNVTITVRDKIVVDAGIDLGFCVNENAYDLSNDPNRIGGNWAGKGVLNNEFDPLIAGVGTHLITYTFTDGFGCEAVDTKLVTVYDTDLVDAGPELTMCNTANILDLSGLASPIGGTWSGPGVAGNAFNPNAVGNGSYVLVYSYVNGNGCKTTDTKTIKVESPASVDIGNNEVVCLSGDIIDLDLNNSLLGGTWSGPGVVGGKFNPNLSGIGNHTISYEYDNGSGCISSASKKIEVRDDIVVNAGEDISICLNSGLVDLNTDVSKQGGIWNGVGINGNTFNPLIAGVGVYNLTYTFTDGFGCEAIDVKVVTVNQVPIVDAGPNKEICTTAAPLQLNLSVFPTGGSWTGVGVTGGVFDPSQVSTGSYDLMYTYVSPSGCEQSDIRKVTVVDPDPIDAGNNKIVCLSSNPVNLDLSVSTIGGTWSGYGVTSNVFYPGDAGVGSHSLVYTYDDGNGCISIDNIIIQVRENILVDAGEDLSFCVSDGKVDLSNDSDKPGGIWSGVGITGNSFDPTIAGAGSHVISYHYQDDFLCETTDTRVFSVYNDPFVDAGPDLQICQTNGLVDLKPYELPSGGTWTGQGVIGSYFNPLLVGIGDYTLTYEFTNGTGCSGTAQKVIQVSHPPGIDAGSAEIVCLATPSFDLDLEVSEQGGYWTGAGVSGGFFTPASAGVGTHVLTYTIDDGSGCISTDTRSIQVRNNITVNSGADLDFCIDDGNYDLTNDPDKLGGTWSGPGISNNTFRPEIAGIGAHIITYSFHDDIGCEATDTRVFKVYTLPFIEAGPPAVVCLTAPSLNLNTSAYPSGGTWTGAGVIDDAFYPDLVGTGTFDLTYTYVNTNGCAVSDQKEVRVNNPPSVDAGPNLTLCYNGASIDLDLDVSEPGGNWSGEGINGSYFDPSIGQGTYIVTYTLDHGGGCVSTDTRNINVREELEVSLGNSLQLCVNDLPIDLASIPSIRDGDWSGPGVTSKNLFDPGVANIGIHKLSYHVTNEFGCSATNELSIEVIGLPEVRSGSDISMCIDADPYDLSKDASPIDGTFSGDAVTGTYFYPSQAGNGIHEITYTYTSLAGCVVEDTRLITVNKLPIVDAGSDFEVCINANPVTLDPVKPSSGGVWSGPGVVAGVFNPLSAGIGESKLYYSFIDDLSCFNRDSIVVKVLEEPDLKIGNEIEMCVDDRPINLAADVNIQGGDFDGDGVNGDYFDPADAGVGSSIITYTIPFNGCEITKFRTIIVNEITPVNIGDDLVMCIDSGPYRVIDDVDVFGGDFSGPGITGHVFDPEAAGLGSHIIRYIYTNAYGCSSEDIRIITVQEQLEIDAGPDLSLCSSLSTYSLGGLGSPTGGIYYGEGVVDNIFDPSIGTGSYSIKYVVESDNGCVSIDSLKITVEPSSITNFGKDTIVCVTSAPINLNFNEELATGTWNGNGVVNNQFFPSLNGPGIYTLSYTNTSLDCDIAGRRTITVVDLPENAVSLESRVTGCIGEFVQLEATVSEEDRNDNVVVRWFKEGADVEFHTGELLTYEIVGEERIYYRSYNQFGCGSGQSSFITIALNNPTAEMVVSDVTPNFGKPIRFQVKNVVNSIGFEWDFGDGTYSNERNPYKFYYETDTFSVSLTLTSSSGCETTIRHEDWIMVGKEIGRSDSTQTLGAGDQLSNEVAGITPKVLTLYPQPTDGKVMLDFMFPENLVGEAYLVGLEGKTNFKEEIRIKEGRNEMEFDFTSVKPGMYFLIIKGGNMKLQTKLIINKK